MAHYMRSGFPMRMEGFKAKRLFPIWHNAWNLKRSHRGRFAKAENFRYMTPASPLSEPGRKKPLSPEERLEAKRVLFSVFFAVFPLLAGFALLIFASSVPGRTLDERAYVVMPYLAMLVIMMDIGGLLYWRGYLGEWLWIACFSLVSLIPMLLGLGMATDAWNRLDDSPPQVRRVTVIKQAGHTYTTRKYGKGTTYIFEVTSWREGEDTLSFSVDRFLPDLSTGRQICIDERPGRLGRSWISEPRLCAPNEAQDEK